MARWVFIWSWSALILICSVRSQCTKSLTVEVNRTEQTLLSPNYPGPYPRPSSCTWNLRASSDSDIIVLRYRYFNIYNSIFCYLDIFSVTDAQPPTEVKVKDSI
ncbi:hypothetical protein RRG08_028591 [Elysia crispata]|uniref:CUB domain-containing protein n=1 Tax=Elysia crispata TaxID=231223 RepID=A0AAE0ZSV0_9GAST|nr:hypothetical protein RRG08_028591 [Elysia crispata]